MVRQSQPAVSLLRPRQVHVLTDRFSMSNSYLVRSKHYVLVNPHSALHVRMLAEYLQRFLSLSINDIELVVLTQLSTDYSLALDLFRHTNPVPVYASAAAIELQKGLLSAKRASSFISHWANQAQPGNWNHLERYLPFYERQTRRVNGWLETVDALPDLPDWRVLPYPAYSPESILLYNPFTAELVAGEAIVTTESGELILRGSRQRRLFDESLALLRRLQIHYIYPGHGRPLLALQPFKRVRSEW
jgi:glyoxylase-like metal-dependent hydrolase (beta-lactamase superfamily II)